MCPEDLREQIPIIAGEEMPFSYGDLQLEMDMINRAYIEVMAAGDSKNRVFTFPIPTYNITRDFDWESENAQLLFDMTARYGLPYFQNFLNSDLEPSMVRSMCCRLQLDLRELLKRGNGLFGSAEQTGSLGVATINCARLGYLYKGRKQALYERLDELMELARDSLETKRQVIDRHMAEGLLPYSKRYLGILRNHFSTIGVNGLNEMIRNYSDDQEDIASEWGKAFALDLLNHVRERMKVFQEETGNLYNLEALDLQDELQTRYTGGTVLHLYMRERISDATTCARFVRRVLENYRLPYITVTPTFSICPVHGYLNGEHEFCPKCDELLMADQPLPVSAIA